MHDKDGMAMINAKKKADLLVDDDHGRLKYAKNSYWVDEKGLWCTKRPRLKKVHKEEHPRAEKA